jgi:hypothetical protein
MKSANKKKEKEIMRRIIIASLLCTLCLLSFQAAAVTKIIESFENSADPADWRCTSPAPQMLNVTTHMGPSAPAFATSHVTDGSQSGQFTFTFTIPGATNATNYYYPGGATLYWADRLSVNATGGLGEGGVVPNNSIFFMDVYNDSPIDIGIAFYVTDNGGSGGYERSPIKALTPNASTTISWDMGTEPCYGWITGDSALNGSNSVFKGLFIYTETQPVQPGFGIFVDNIRISSQADTTPPAVPVILSATQGSAPGKLLVTWAANTELDMKEYNIYQGDDQNWGVALSNRLQLPMTPKATVAHPGTSVEIDVPTTGPVYLHMTAMDNALPVNNESGSAIAIGASLRPDGAIPDDMVILDLNRRVAGTSGWLDEGYYHDIVYYAQALDDLGRYFESGAAAGVANSMVTLIPNPDGFVAWANNRDGEDVIGQSISDANVSKLTDFVEDGGNLMISGTALGEDLQTNGSTAGKAFYANILKASLSSDNVAVNEIVGGTAPFAGVGTFQTGADIYNRAAGATLDNEGLSSNGSYGAMSYTGAAGYPAVFWGNKVVYFGFAWETVRDNATANFAAARAKRTAILSDTVDYLLLVLTPADAMWSLYE